MSVKNIRQYVDILSRIKSSLDGLGRWVRLGEISDSITSHPIDKIILGENNSRRVLISAGIHGDEPAGVETICSFIENKDFLKFLEKWEMTLIPCINPFGYEANTRTNHEGIDLNRKFKSMTPPKEVELAQKLFASPFDLTIELHEDVDSAGYYFFHSSVFGSRPPLVEEILNNVKTVMPINMNSEIDGIQADRGVIARTGIDKSLDWWPMAFYSLSKGTQTCLTLETGTQFSMQIRVKAHLIAIETALDLLAKGTEEQ